VDTVARAKFLRDYAGTDRQRELLDAIAEHGSQRGAAKALGLQHGVIRRVVRAVETAATRAGADPEHFVGAELPVGLKVRGTSTAYDENGNVRLQWVKTQASDQAQFEAVEHWAEWLAAGVDGRATPLAPPERSDDSLLSVYPVFDPHCGLYSWAPETGEDFNVTEAERRICGTADRLVASTPNTDHALLILGGDIYHINDGSHATPESRNQLDVDTRLPHVAEAGLRAITHIVERLRAKHSHVTIAPIRGNHDSDMVVMLTIILRAYYRHEPRIDVESHPSLYAYHRFGRVLIGMHHGHGAKMTELPLLMASDRPEDWGGTRHRYWYCGHIHHRTRDKEHPGVMVETFNALTATDAYHHGRGYRNTAKNLQAVIHHAEDGEIERHTCSVDRLNRLTSA